MGKCAAVIFCLVYACVVDTFQLCWDDIYLNDIYLNFQTGLVSKCVNTVNCLLFSEQGVN